MLHRSVIFLAFCALAVFGSVSAHATTLDHGPSPAVQAENDVETIEIGRVRLQNIKNGLVEGSRDEGKTWTTIGHVTVPCIKVNVLGFTASKWGRDGTVVATAVNAIHLRSGYNEKENRGIIWSLAPLAEDMAGKNSLQQEISPQSAVYTDMPGGTGIFGGPFTPFLGNPLFLDNDRNNTLAPLPSGYIPKLGDSWVWQVRRPKRYPREIIFENRFGGLITIQYRGEEPKVIGQVLRPVVGIGRFVGSYFSDPGRLRANHEGVIDITTSPRGVVGSFQIVPANHAMSAETHYIREQTQWMVVGPVSATDPSYEGTAPLFARFLRPRYDEADWKNPDTIEGIAGRFYFDVQMRDKNTWQKMPTLWIQADKPLPQWANTALENVGKIRIVFPFVWDEIPLTMPTNMAPSVAPIANAPDAPMATQ
ncbi:hypothetical protein IAD21_01836 [Abditibacteriota bacterium]|nr:hypothetical protein IAD21_01836 [Abditibacteriota bacterium]